MESAESEPKAIDFIAELLATSYSTSTTSAHPESLLVTPAIVDDFGPVLAS